MKTILLLCLLLSACSPEPDPSTRTTSRYHDASPDLETQPGREEMILIQEKRLLDQIETDRTWSTNKPTDNTSKP